MCPSGSRHPGAAALRELRAGEPGTRLLDGSSAPLPAVRLLRRHTPPPERFAPACNALAGVPLGRVIAYIEDHLADDLPLAAVAAVANLSPFHFARLFRDATGVPPHRYIIGRRVERAKLLLAATEWSLAAIAHEVGFADGSHLTRHFKRETGVTPRAYRAYRPPDRMQVGDMRPGAVSAY